VSWCEAHDAARDHSPDAAGVHDELLSSLIDRMVSLEDPLVGIHAWELLACLTSALKPSRKSLPLFKQLCTASHTPESAFVLMHLEESSMKPMRESVPIEEELTACSSKRPGFLRVTLTDGRTLHVPVWSWSTLNDVLDWVGIAPESKPSFQLQLVHNRAIVRSLAQELYVWDVIASLQETSVFDLETSFRLLLRVVRFWDIPPGDSVSQDLMFHQAQREVMTGLPVLTLAECAEFSALVCVSEAGGDASTGSRYLPRWCLRKPSALDDFARHLTTHAGKSRQEARARALAIALASTRFGVAWFKAALLPRLPVALLGIHRFGLTVLDDQRRCRLFWPYSCICGWRVGDTELIVLIRTVQSGPVKFEFAMTHATEAFAVARLEMARRHRRSLLPPSMREMASGHAQRQQELHGTHASRGND
jgi:hypothetical protein